jgi:hypothetical protein
VFGSTKIQLLLLQFDLISRLVFLVLAVHFWTSGVSGTLVLLVHWFSGTSGTL